MREEVYMPFYSIVEDNLVYLEKHTVCKLPKEKKIRKKILEDEGAVIVRNKSKNNENKIMPKILVLEPHPDDFALSALGYINNNDQVLVLNIFSNMKLESFTWKEYFNISKKEYEELRLKESKIAIEEMLKYKFLSLKETSTRIKQSNIKDIQKRIIYNTAKIIENYPIDTVMVPMGIGNHPDHIIVYDSIIENYIKLFDQKIKIVFYPEYPYARCKKSYLDRLNKIEQNHKLKTKVVNVERKIENIVNCISVYKSQHDDINKKQMLAIVREDCKAIATEYKKEKLSLVYYVLER